MLKLIQSLIKSTELKTNHRQSEKDVLKNRLGLENFSGLSAQAVRQDFHASALLTGMESILTDDAEEVLANKPLKNAQKANKAVSFHTRKKTSSRKSLDYHKRRRKVCY